MAPGAIAAPIAVEAFAARDAISDAAISPDGRYLALVSTIQERRAVTVRDLKQAPSEARMVLADVPGKFDISWCRWATGARLLCSYRGIQSLIANETQLVATRLVAVDPDGRNQLVLVQNSDAAGGRSAQFEDRIIDWHPGKANTVLIEADESLLGSREQNITKGGGGDIYLKGGIARSAKTSTRGYPAIFELNVVNGNLELLQHSYPPIRHFLTDFHGAPRVASGFQTDSKTIEYFVRAPNSNGWHHLLKYEAFAKGELRTPIAIDAQDPMRAYAIGDSGGRNALWSVDLNDVAPPKLVYANDSVDVEGAEFLKDGALIGVAYDTDRPHMYYIDARLQPIMQQLDTALSETTNRIVDCTADLSLCIVRSSGDVQPGVWMLLDTSTQRLTALGRSNPALDPEQLAHMQPISYPARDGTMIPGYLTKPPDAPAGVLPLIVMPHGGPIARDRWNYFFLQQFLVSRGYAVLQMNFRGSGGYGSGWSEAAHQDWGGLTYDDIIDGVHWAIKSGLADPARISIVGWGFGGYSALLGAVRDSDLFRCAVSIGGISDLGLLLQQERHYYSSEIAREQIGTQQAKLEADSPRRHAADIKVPVLMFHGDLDTRVAVDQSKAMAATLKAANKPFRYVEIKGADERINDPHDRALMLRGIEEFLAANMGSANAPPAAP
jgi:dipeptidyl aminopeptidase/acylaminoacyl peptidase